MAEQKEDIIIVFNPKVDDSFGAAWLFNRFASTCPSVGNVLFVTEGDAIPVDSAEKKHIIFLKTKYLPDVIDNYSKQFKTLLFLHNGHEIDDINVPDTGVSLHEHLTSDSSYIVCSDIDKSVTAHAFILIHPSDPLPTAVRLIDRQVRAICLEDKELKEFTLGLRNLERTFDAWNKLLTDVEDVMKLGSQLLELHNQVVKEAGDRSRSVSLITPDGNKYIGYLTEAEAKYCNDITTYISINRLDDAPCFVACYTQLPDGKYNYSIRGVDMFDVLPICKAFGGGGNNKAGGFVTNTLFQ